MPRTGTALTTALTVGLALIATGAALLTLLNRRIRISKGDPAGVMSMIFATQQDVG